MKSGTTANWLMAAGRETHIRGHLVLIRSVERPPAPEGSNAEFLRADEVAGISFRLDLSDRYVCLFIRYWITQCGGIVCDDGEFVVSDTMPRSWNVFRVSQMKFAFDGSLVSSSPFPCRIAVFDTDGAPVVPAAIINYPELVVFPMAEPGYSPFRGLFEPPQKEGRDSQRRKFVSAAPSGVCHICKVSYTDSQQHRSSLLHLSKREAEDLWTDFDELAKRVNLLR